jgi:hypothetical protein
MGELGRRLFASCGYKSERVVPTGSPRYDEAVRFVQLGSPAVRFAGKGVLEVLMTVSVDFWLEMDMVEAVCLAAEGLKNVRLRMRCHPDRRLDEDPKFRPYKDKVIVSGASLQEDLTAADIVIFTFTTVGEEAYLDGVNVWQWLPLGYNGSALSAVADILKFSRVEALREAFRLALEGRMPPTVGNKERCEVLRQLFHSSDGLAARRIAQKCADMLKKNSVSAPERTNE